jgi:hypothetical protein
MQSTQFSPCAELRELLLPAYAPCTHFEGVCKGLASWAPANGHVPRGFVGALGSLDEIELVLVAAEPGNPLLGETYKGTDPADFLDRCAKKAYRDFDQAYRDSDRNKDFHRNIRRWILDKCFPNLDFSHQMRRTWITESYLCSAQVEGGNVRAVSWRTCARNYLLPQLWLLKDRTIVALGQKAQQRMQGFDGPFLRMPAAGPPEGNKFSTRESWKAIPQYLRGSDPTPRPG